MKLCKQCSDATYREDAEYCVRHQLIYNWSINTDVDHLGVFEFFKHVIPKAFKNFKYGIPRFHKEIVWEVIRDEPGWKFYNRQIAIQIFRGASKTTLVSKALALYYAVTGQKKYIVISSKTSRSAEKNLRWIKQTLLTNKFIIQIFGNLVPGRYKVGDTVQGKWTSNFIILSNGTCIETIGMGQHLRGSAEGEDVARIDLFIADDTESNENTKTPERREDNFDWLFETVLPTLDIDTGTIVFINTLTHTGSILAALMKDVPENNWRRINYPLYYVNEKGELISNWAEKFPLVICKAIENNYRINPRKGYNSFCKEYLNIIRSDKGLDPTLIKYWTGRLWYEFGHNWIEIVDGNTKKVMNVNTYCGIDGAYSMDAKANYSVVFAIAVDAFNRKYILEYKRGRMSVFDRVSSEGQSYIGFIDEADRMYGKYKFNHIVFGTEGQQGGYYTQLRDRFKGRTRVLPHNNSGNKIDTIGDYLIPQYEAGQWHHRGTMTALYEEWISLGDATDDVIDAQHMSALYAKIPKGLEYNPVFGGMEEGTGIEGARNEESILDKIRRKSSVFA